MVTPALNLHLLRTASGKESTLGSLYRVHASGVFQFLCFTLEDQHQFGPKVPRETRIPAGSYEIKLRPPTQGNVNKKYAKRFNNHHGMLWLQDVPEFEWIYIHCGNTDDHTEGCLLVGETVGMQKNGTLTIGQSAKAYEKVYSLVSTALLAGHWAAISVNDYDDPESTMRIH